MLDKRHERVEHNVSDAGVEFRLSVGRGSLEPEEVKGIADCPKRTLIGSKVFVELLCHPLHRWLKLIVRRGDSA